MVTCTSAIQPVNILSRDHALDARQTLPGHPEICSLNSFWVIRDKSRVKKVAATSIFDAGRKSTNHFLLASTRKLLSKLHTVSLLADQGQTRQNR